MIMAIACVAGILTMAYRGFSFLFGWHEVTPFQFRDTLTTVFYMINYLGMFFLAFGFVLSTVEQAAEQNRRMALIDPLTGLFNRRALFEAMEKLFFKAEAEGQPLSLMIMDVDLFKQVNDVYGHQAGDIVLKRVANTINGRLRHGDIVGRIGGEEFLAVLPETPPEGALQLAEELRRTMAAESVIFKEQKIQVTISVGLYSSVSLVSSQTPDSAIASADKALYRAKNNGRNRVETNQVMTAISA
jgi:diguanylate cyclase (GGDEF)-like protein